MAYPAFARSDHRPFPMPTRRWSWRQRWLDLLFAHWPVPKEQLQALVPSELEVQEFDGTSWIGVVPFRMEDVMLRPLPALPGISAFPELNVRIYVEHQGVPGVWFFSLDASNWLAVRAARTFFHLPYFHSRMRCDADGEGIDYESTRRKQPRGLSFRARYRPISGVYHAEPGTLEHWLTERYCLFARSPGGQLFRGDIHHLPWPLQRAEAEIEVNDMTRPQGIELAGPPAHLHFARRIDVAVWSLTRTQAS
jgi:uncharacterized protein YqjF (DUF2071 family)